MKMRFRRHPARGLISDDHRWPTKHHRSLPDKRCCRFLDSSFLRCSKWNYPELSVLRGAHHLGLHARQIRASLKPKKCSKIGKRNITEAGYHLRSNCHAGGLDLRNREGVVPVAQPKSIENYSGLGLLCWRRMSPSNNSEENQFQRSLFCIPIYHLHADSVLRGLRVR